MSQSLSILKSKSEELPNNIEAEQSVIGSVLLSNEIFLAVIVFSFGIVFPLAKLITSFFEGLGSIPNDNPAF